MVGGDKEGTAIEEGEGDDDGMRKMNSESQLEEEDHDYNYFMRAERKVLNRYRLRYITSKMIFICLMTVYL